MRNLKIVLLFLLATMSLLNAQMPQIQFEKITSANGLIDAAAVLEMYQDQQGFMWFGTSSGLSKYDGYSFKNYRANDVDSTSLSNAAITCIYEDYYGKLWMGTMWGGLNKFDPTTEEFKIYQPIPGDSTSLISLNVFDIVATDNKGIWIATLGGLEYFDFKSEIFTHYNHDPDDSQSLSSNSLRDLHVDKSGNLWVGAGNWFNWQTKPGGLNIFNPKTKKVKRFLHEPDNKFSLMSNDIGMIVEDKNGTIYIGTDESTLHRYDKVNDRIERLSEKSVKMPFAPSVLSAQRLGDVRPFTWSILQDMDDFLWIGSFGGGLNRFDLTNGVMKYYSHDINNRYGISSNNVIKIYENREGTVWTAIERNGINKVISSRNRFHSYIPNKILGEFLSNNFIRTIFETSNGQLLIGTDFDVILFDPVKGTMKRFTEISDINIKNINCFYEDPEGIIWFGGQGMGFVKVDFHTGKSKLFVPTETEFTIEDQVDTELGTWIINSFSPDQDGNIWLSTNYAGLDLYNPETEKFKHYHYDSLDTRSLSSDNVFVTYIDSKKNLWIGTDSGVNKNLKAKDDFDRYLDGFIVREIIEDSHNNLWMGTEGEGLIRFNRETNEYKQFTTDDGLLNNDILSIAEGNEGILWIATPGGLSQMDTKTLSLISFNKEDGIENKFSRNANAAIKTRKGEMLFSTDNGIMAFSPDEFEANKFPPKIAITNLFVHDKPLKEKGTLDSIITLDYYQNDLTFEYVGLHFTNPSRNKYSVKLEPYEEDWTKPNNLRKARYTNLSSGEYTFFVKASNSDGIWNEEGKQLTIIINPPPWATWWAYTLYVIFGIGFLYFIRRLELNKQNKNAEVKESKMRAEAAELQAKAAEAQSRAVQVENERKSKELDEARQLQLSMLPKEIPQLPNLEIAVFMKTATEVGGDYYDFTFSKNGELNIALGDATGHGMQAGTMVTLMKGMFTAEGGESDILEFFSRSSGAIKEIHLSRLMLAFLLLKINKNELELINAGMPPLLIYRSASNIVEEIDNTGMPLGAIKNYPYQKSSTSIKKDDVILMLTDGLPELQNSNEEQFGYEKVTELFKKNAGLPAEQIIEKLKDEGSAWVNDKDPDDDVTFVVIKVKG